MTNESERWEKSGPFDHNGNPWEEDAAGEGSWPMWPILDGNVETIAECWDERYADLICALHNERAGLEAERDRLDKQAQQSWDERITFMQERDRLLVELSRIDDRLHKLSGHWLSRDAMIDAAEQALTAERERAEKLEEQRRKEAGLNPNSVLSQVWADLEDDKKTLEAQLQAEREKAARLENALKNWWEERPKEEMKEFHSRGLNVGAFFCHFCRQVGAFPSSIQHISTCPIAALVTPTTKAGR